MINQPENTIAKNEILERWNTIHLQSELIISQFEGKFKRMGVFKHPKTGWLNISQAISFLRFHQFHHLRQLDAMLSELN